MSTRSSTKLSLTMTLFSSSELPSLSNANTIIICVQVNKEGASEGLSTHQAGLLAEGLDTGVPPLHPQVGEDAAGTRAVVAGWGTIQEDSTQTADVLL